LNLLRRGPPFVGVDTEDADDDDGDDASIPPSPPSRFFFIPLKVLLPNSDTCRVVVSTAVGRWGGSTFNDKSAAAEISP